MSLSFASWGIRLFTLKFFWFEAVILGTTLEDHTADMGKSLHGWTRKRSNYDRTRLMRHVDAAWRDVTHVTCSSRVPRSHCQCDVGGELA